MAQASSRRPQIVEEELKVASMVVPKFKLNFYSKFLEMLGAWYSTLRKGEKDKLTPKRLKRRAVYILDKLNYPYDSLPSDWVGTAMDQFGIRLYEKVKKPNKSIVGLEEAEIQFVLDPMGVMPGRAARLMGLAVNGKIVDCGKEIKQEIKQEVNDEEEDSCWNGGEKDNGEEVVDNGDGEGPRKRRKLERKKLVDLTSLPPPTEWVQAHANGIYLPRELTIYSGDTQTVLFYDYSPKVKSVDPSIDLSKCKQKVHEQNNFIWVPRRHCVVKKPGEVEDVVCSDDDNASTPDLDS